MCKNEANERHTISNSAKPKTQTKQQTIQNEEERKEDPFDGSGLDLAEGKVPNEEVSAPDVAYERTGNDQGRC